MRDWRSITPVEPQEGSNPFWCMSFGGDRAGLPSPESAKVKKAVA